MLKTILLVLCAVALSACSSVKVEDYATNEPVLVPETFFDGKLQAHGIVKNRGGKVIRYFSADIDAWWENGVGTLDERFIFE